MTDGKLSSLLNFKKLGMRQHLGSLQSPCIGPSFDILAVFGRGGIDLGDGGRGKVA